MEATLMLCDFAEDLNGKLYIMGGGWSRIIRREPVVSMYLAVRLEIPWDRANERLPLKLWLETEDGVVVQDADGQELLVEAMLEAGRPAGLEKGSPLDSVLTLRVKDLPLDEGRYTWKLEVAGELSARTVFGVVVPNA